VKFRNTIILLAVLAALVVIWILVKGEPGTKEWREREKRVLDLDAETVTKLEIVRGGARLVIEKQDDRWRMTEPIAARASAGEAEAVARELESLEYTDRIFPGKRSEKGLSAYGLDNPAAVIAAVADDKTHTLRMGASTPLGTGIYVMADDSDVVYVVARGILDTAGKPVNDWRDKDLLAFARTDVNRIAVDRADSPGIVLVRRDAGWRMAAPVADGGEESAVNDLLDKLDGLSIDTFVNDSPSDLKVYGLDAPVLNVTIREVDEDKNETRDHTVLLGKPLPDDAEKVYAKAADEPYVYAVEAKALTDLAPSVFRLRRKSFAEVATYQAWQVAITAPGREVVLAKDTEDRWVLKKPDLGTAEGNTVRDFLDALNNATVETFLDTQPLLLADLGLDEKARTAVAVTLREDEADTGSERVVTFLLGKRTEDGKRLYVKRAADAFALAVKTKIDETLTLGDLAFRDRAVLDFEKAKARKLTVVRDGVTVTCTRPDDEDEWSMTVPVKAKVDTSNVDNILWDLMSLRAKKLVAEKPQDLRAYGLDKPIVVATVTYKDKDDEKKTHTKTLEIGAKTDDDTRYARLTDGDLVFTIAKSVVENLQDELHDRKVMDFDKDKVKAVTVAHAGQPPFTFVKEDGQWQLEDRESIEVRSSAVEDVLSDLDYLQTERFAAYEAKDLAPHGLDKPRVVVTVKLEAEERKVLVGSALEDGKALARAGTSNDVFELKKEEAEHLLRYLGDYLYDPTTTQPTTKPAPQPTTRPATQPAAP